MVAVLAFALAFAQVPEGVRRPPSPRARSYLVPAIEAALVDVGLATFNNLVSREPFAQISLESVRVNLPLSAWGLDADYFLTNQFGHPYQGAWSFTAARSAGLGFWVAAVYPFFASLLWELVFEVDAPSVNDHITTTLGGVFLGEALFRITLLVANSALPRWLKEVFIFLLSPPVTLNRALFDGQLGPRDVSDSPFFRGWLGGGVFVQSGAARVGAFLTTRLSHGAANEAPSGPFSHFDLHADLSIDRRQVTGDFTIRGLLWGKGFHLGALDGIGGVFGGYEYVAPQVFRASSVNVGAGTMLCLSTGANTTVELTLIASGIPFGAGGTVAPSEPMNGRDYHVGPGVHLEGELSLASERLGVVSVGVRRWNFFGGLYAPPAGHDAITYLHANAHLRLGAALVGLEFVRALRDSNVADTPVRQALSQLRLTVSWLLVGITGLSPERR
ncbi:MAG: DUF3943 domain-containing protein [Myxococcaceae bacterium]|jgi:hypothetical protein|nr:DUF3943 domain-containing protein [Myxococcaceae bacterium]